MIDKLNADWLLPAKRLNWVKSKRPVYGKSFLQECLRAFVRNRLIF